MPRADKDNQHLAAARKRVIAARKCLAAGRTGRKSAPPQPTPSHRFRRVYRFHLTPNGPFQKCQRRDTDPENFFFKTNPCESGASTEGCDVADQPGRAGSTGSTGSTRRNYDGRTECQRAGKAGTCGPCGPSRSYEVDLRLFLCRVTYTRPPRLKTCATHPFTRAVMPNRLPL